MRARDRFAAGTPVASYAAARRAHHRPDAELAARYWHGILVFPLMANWYTDATFLGAVGIPTYGVPRMGESRRQRPHGLNERIEVLSVCVGRDYVFDLIKAYAD